MPNKSNLDNATLILSVFSVHPNQPENRSVDKMNREFAKGKKRG
jgi:hypothetical protein